MRKDLPIRYLGVPLFVGAPKQSYFPSQAFFWFFLAFFWIECTVQFRVGEVTFYRKGEE